MNTIEPAEPRPFAREVLDLGTLLLHPWGREGAERYGLVDALTEATTDPDIARWDPFPATGRAAAEQHLDRCDARWDGGGSAPFAVLDAGSGTLLGNAGIRWVDRPDGLAMVGYWLLPAARGRGVATAAIRAVTAWGVRTAGARRIEIAHAVGNDASCRVAERCGFPAEGTLRASHNYGGTYRDEHLHARLATDPD